MYNNKLVPDRGAPKMKIVRFIFYMALVEGMYKATFKSEYKYLFSYTAMILDYNSTIFSTCCNLFENNSRMAQHESIIIYDHIEDDGNKKKLPTRTVLKQSPNRTSILLFVVELLVISGLLVAMFFMIR